MKCICSCCGAEFTDFKECLEHESGCHIVVREVRLSLYDFSITSTIKFTQDVSDYLDGDIITMKDTILTKTAEKKLKLRVIAEGIKHIRDRKNKIKVALSKCDSALSRLTELTKDVRQNKDNNKQEEER